MEKSIKVKLQKHSSNFIRNIRMGRLSCRKFRHFVNVKANFLRMSNTYASIFVKTH